MTTKWANQSYFPVPQPWWVLDILIILAPKLQRWPFNTNIFLLLCLYVVYAQYAEYRMSLSYLSWVVWIRRGREPLYHHNSNGVGGKCPIFSLSLESTGWKTVIWLLLKRQIAHKCKNSLSTQDKLQKSRRVAQGVACPVVEEGPFCCTDHQGERQVLVCCSLPAFAKKWLIIIVQLQQELTYFWTVKSLEILLLLLLWFIYPYCLGVIRQHIMHSTCMSQHSS